jgi:hypothetical protein
MICKKLIYINIKSDSLILIRNLYFAEGMDLLLCFLPRTLLREENDRLLHLIRDLLPNVRRAFMSRDQQLQVSSTTYLIICLHFAIIPVSTPGIGSASCADASATRQRRRHRQHIYSRHWRVSRRCV